MKKALAGLLTALTADPSLPIRSGDPFRHSGHGPTLLGSRRNQIIAGSVGGALVVAAGALAFSRKRRRGKTAVSAPSATPEPASAQSITPPEPPAA